MLAEERFNRILRLVDRRSFIRIDELTEALNASESTIRRDLSYLDSEGMLKRVHGGAIAVAKQYGAMDEEVSERRRSNIDQKQRIARYAAGCIEDGDFIFIDSGTTTELIIDCIEAEDVTCATNSLTIAKLASAKCKRVFLIGGEFKTITEATVGANALDDLRKYNFIKGFFGANSVDLKAGYTTPDINEAMVKRQAFQRSMQRYVLADPSKMNGITSFTFGELVEATMITTRLHDRNFAKITNVIEVDDLESSKGVI